VESKKICKHCEIEKDINQFPTYLKASTGETCYRNVCRSCRTIQINKSKGLNPQPKKITYAQTVDNIKQTYNNYKVDDTNNIFTDDQLKNLKLIAENTNKIMQILDTKIIMPQELDKANRIPKTINLNSSIYNKIQSYCKEKNLSISDVINTLLESAVKVLD